jgi:toxin ParE1/3/4
VNWRLDIRPAALADIEEAAAWYEERQPGLGADFVRAIRTAINTLPQNPLICRVRDRRRRARWLYPERFPYRVVYHTADDLITVFAVVHAARHNREGRKRL